MIRIKWFSLPIQDKFKERKKKEGSNWLSVDLLFVERLGALVALLPGLAALDTVAEVPLA